MPLKTKETKETKETTATKEIKEMTEQNVQHEASAQIHPAKDLGNKVDTAETYEFSGTHYLANYCDCLPGRLTNIAQLREIMEKAVGASGATILQMIDHVFENKDFPESPGYTSVFLLSESHATIHTYPEVNSCFIDIFTCGTKCSYVEFDKCLSDYLKPGKVNLQVVKRDSEIETLQRHALVNCLS